jgi:four helix bundle protein
MCKEKKSKTEKPAKENNDLSERIYQFVIRIVNLVKELPNTIAGNRIGGQLLDAGTSVGANYEEAQAAFSKADFTYKMSTARKEAYETNYWLRVIRDTNLLPKKRMGPIIQESEEIKKILTRSVKTATENPERRGRVQD